MELPVTFSIQDVARFGCVSKRCGQLFLSTPTLKFDGFPQRQNTSADRSRLVDALDSFMIRRGDDKIHTFCLDGFFVGYLNYSISWIHKALRCNVEVLDFKFPSYRSSLPGSPTLKPQLNKMFESIFGCGSLKSLSVNMDMCMGNEWTTRLPSSACFSNIECIKLRNIHVLDEGFFRWISSSCKYIKELHLGNVDGIKHLSIESPSLSSFSFASTFWTDSISISAEKLVELVIDWGCYSCERVPKVLKITAPGVRYMKLEGSSFIHLNLGVFKCLEEADVCLRPGGYGIINLSEFIN